MALFSRWCTVLAFDYRHVGFGNANRPSSLLELCVDPETYERGVRYSTIWIDGTLQHSPVQGDWYFRCVPSGKVVNDYLHVIFRYKYVLGFQMVHTVFVEDSISTWRSINEPMGYEVTMSRRKDIAIPLAMASQMPDSEPFPADRLDVLSAEDVERLRLARLQVERIRQQA